MMKKMTDHVWLSESGEPITLDITQNYKGEKITLKPIYFKRGN